MKCGKLDILAGSEQRVFTFFRLGEESNDQPSQAITGKMETSATEVSPHMRALASSQTSAATEQFLSMDVQFPRLQQLALPSLFTL